MTSPSVTNILRKYKASNPRFASYQFAHLEGRLVVVGLDAADVVRRGRVERRHQLLQGLAELKADLKAKDITSLSR